VSSRLLRMDAPIIARVSDAEPVPWRNGGGTTSVLATWPDATDWIVRVSVAEILVSGPFSTFPGVERWFAVLSGEGVRLDTEAAEAREIDPDASTLHRFSGDRPTWCTARGARTEDLNVMLRRDRGRLHERPLAAGAELATRAEWAGLFVVAPTDVTAAGGATWPVPGMALASWPNPRREPRRLRAVGHAGRGWWLEVDRA
jgi:uncharacterized protein